MYGYIETVISSDLRIVESCVNMYYNVPGHLFLAPSAFSFVDCSLTIRYEWLY